MTRFSSIPGQLAATFTPGQVGATTQAAVMTFEAAHNLAVDGEIGTKVWSAPGRRRGAVNPTLGHMTT